MFQFAGFHCRSSGRVLALYERVHELVEYTSTRVSTCCLWAI